VSKGKHDELADIVRSCTLDSVQGRIKVEEERTKREEMRLRFQREEAERQRQERAEDRRERAEDRRFILQIVERFSQSQSQSQSSRMNTADLQSMLSARRIEEEGADEQANN